MSFKSIVFCVVFTLAILGCQSSANFEAGDGDDGFESYVFNALYFDIENSLVWELVPSHESSYSTAIWAEAEKHCEDLRVVGEEGIYEDWRLPTIDELRTLVVGCDEPSCLIEAGTGPNGCYWPDAFSGVCARYWSLSRCGEDSRSAVTFSFARTDCWPEDQPAIVRCVRDL